MSMCDPWQFDVVPSTGGWWGIYPPNNVCPGCGRCNYCGRPNYQPAQPCYPTYPPYYPYWYVSQPVSTGTGQIGTIKVDTTTSYAYNS